MNKLFFNTGTRKMKIALSALAVVLVLGSVFAYVSWSNNSDLPGNASDDEITIDPNKGGDKTGFSNSDDPKVDSGSGTDVSSNTGNGPDKPYGNFVNNHSVKMGSEIAENMSSICHTTPGAECLIRFTHGETIRELEMQKVDGNGKTQWYWSLNDVGLTAGSWKVEAAATLNGKESVTVDPIKLEVSS